MKDKAEVTNPLYGKFDEVTKAMFPPVLPKEEPKPKPQKRRRSAVIPKRLRRQAATP